MADKIDLVSVSYVLGILSIVFAFISAWGVGGIVLGIVGLIFSKKAKSASAKRLNIIGFVLGIVIFVISVFAAYYFADYILSSGVTGAFPSI